MNQLSQSRRPLAKLLATGQTTSYVDYDDGYYEKGIVKSYTVLTTGQYSGTTDITLNEKTDSHSNNCVFDNNTGLMWSRTHMGAVGPANDGQLPFTANANGEGIFTYLAAANAASLAGFSDWRIPNRLELLSLLVCEAAAGKFDSTAFPTISWQTLWTSSTVPNSTGKAVLQGNASTMIYGEAKTYAWAYCCMVRG